MHSHPPDLLPAGQCLPLAPVLMGDGAQAACSPFPILPGISSLLHGQSAWEAGPSQINRPSHERVKNPKRIWAGVL